MCLSAIAVVLVVVDAVAVVQFMFIPYFINFNTNINYFKHAVCVLLQGSWRSFWKETGNKRRRVFPKIGNLSQFISFVYSRYIFSFCTNSM